MGSQNRETLSYFNCFALFVENNLLKEDLEGILFDVLTRTSVKPVLKVCLKKSWAGGSYLMF